MYTVIGRRTENAGRFFMMIRYSSLVIGHQLLVIGHWSLAIREAV
jgi:hypothetical protein